MINYYVVLEIPEFSDETAIKKAYRSLSKKYHPDVNQDPSATEHFLKIREAYDFLMNDNKRLLLNQYLLAVRQGRNQSSRKSEYRSSDLKPVIHFFAVDKKTFTLNDYVLVQWSVSQCRSVRLNIAGEVGFSGTHYLKITHFSEEVIVLMTVVGLDGREYNYQIKLKYRNDHPVVRAYHQMLSKNPKTKQVHFKPEKFLDTHGRIGRTTFRNRMILLFIILAVNCLFYSLATYKHFMFVVLGFNLWFIYVQCYKRIHDIKSLKEKVYKLWIPFYNILIIKELFQKESEKEVSEFGIIPHQDKTSFSEWIKKGINKLTGQMSLLHKISMGTYLVVLLAIGIKSYWNYEEIPAKLTSKYVETSRPTKAGHVHKNYFLVFNKNLTVEVTEIEFHNILEEQNNSVFSIGVNRKGKVQFINVIDKKSDKAKRLNSGVLGNANPALLIITFLFLAQVYAWRNLTKPDEKPYGNGFMVFVMLIYLYTFWLIFF